MNKELDGRKPPSLNIFWEYVGLTEEEFNQIVGQMTVPPNEPDFSNIPNSITWILKTGIARIMKKIMIGIIDYGVGNLASVKTR